MYLQKEGAHQSFPADSMVYLLLVIIESDAQRKNIVISDICRCQFLDWPRAPRRKVTASQLSTKWAAVNKYSEKHSVSKMKALKAIAMKINRKSRMYPWFFEYLRPGYLFLDGMKECRGVDWRGVSAKSSITLHADRKEPQHRRRKREE